METLPKATLDVFRLSGELVAAVPVDAVENASELIQRISKMIGVPHYRLLGRCSGT